MSRSVERLSASGVKKYIGCPKQFWYYYLSDIELPETDEPEFFKVGNAVHDSLENVLQRSPGLINDEDALLVALQEEEEGLNHGYESDSSSKVQGCLEVAAGYIADFVTRVDSVEDRWEIERRDLDFTGFADLVADVESGEDVLENVIVDWKTGKEQDEWKERIQGGMYLEMFYEENGYYPDGIEFIYLDEKTRSSHSRISDGEVMWNETENKYWTQIEKEMNDILKSDAKNEWPADPDSKGCYFCDYKLVCEDYIGAESTTPEKMNFGAL